MDDPSLPLAFKIAARFWQPIETIFQPEPRAMNSPMSNRA
jgi:DNA-binding XRE family transcriptional regulator